MKKLYFIVLSLLLVTAVNAQIFTVEGYVFEDNNRGFLNSAKVEIYMQGNNMPIDSTFSDEKGFFSFTVPQEGDYKLTVEKKLMYDWEGTFSTKGKNPNEKQYLKIKMTRQPGYIFEVTMAESRENEDIVVDAVQGSKIEVYNNTKDEEVLVLQNHIQPTWSVPFEQGNHYTIFIRKKGYFAKRVEAYVNVEGCILCIDGVKKIRPGVTDNLTDGLKSGTLLANIELQKAEVNQVFKIENIYYDLDKWDIRPEAALELDKVVNLLKNNPGLKLELGSHTDSRGSDTYNLNLSDKRARSAVGYIVDKGNINKNRITARGYGETVLVNKCANGVECSEESHQKNRRTEIRVLHFYQDILEFNKPLSEIIRLERFDKLALEFEAGEEIQIGKDGKIVKPGSEEDASEEGVKKGAEKAKDAEEKKIAESIEKEPDSKVAIEEKPSLKVEKAQDKQEVKPAKTPEIATDLKAPVVEDQTKLKEKEEKKVVLQAAPRMEVKPKRTPAIETRSKAAPELKANMKKDSKPRGELKVETIKTKKYKKVPMHYNGYKVQVMVLDKSLSPDHDLFEKHGNVYMERLSNGMVAYLIGDFQDKKIATWFAENTLKPKFPDAKMIEYRNGIRDY